MRVVTDFGVAKALSSATSMDAGVNATSVGTVIGTPAYMAPEQGAGEPDVGPAADLYALGVTGFEIVTGATPFKGTTPRAILAAQLTSEPPTLETVRPDIPPAYASLIRRLLARDPADRPAAAELRGLMEQVGTPPPGTLITPPLAVVPRKGRTLRLALGVAAGVAVLLLALQALGLLPTRTLLAEGKFATRDPVVLADVDVAGDSSLGSALTEALRVDLSQSDVLQLLSSSQVRSTLRLMQQPEDRALGPTLAREVAVRSGAKGVVVGKVERIGGQMIVTLRLVSPESGDDLAAFRETAKDSTVLLNALDAVTKQMRRRIGESLSKVRASQPLEAVTTSSLVALQKYSQAVKASDRGDYAQAQQLLQEAVTIDTAFASAWRKLGVSMANQGNSEESKKPITRAFQFRDRLPDRERYLTMGSYYTTVGYDNNKAAAAYRAVLEVDSLDPIATNNLALVLGTQGDSLGSLRYYQRSTLARDSSLVALNNLAAAFDAAGFPDSALAILRLADKRDPGNIRVQGMVASVAYGRGDYATAEQIARKALTDPKLPMDLRFQALDGTRGMALMQGRVKLAAEDTKPLTELASSAGQQGSYYNPLEDIAAARAVFFSDAPGGRRLLDSVLTARPLSSIPAGQRPYLSIAYTYAQIGDPAKARSYLAQAQANTDTAEWRGSLPFRHFVQAEIAMAEKRPADAIRELTAINLQEGTCRACWNASLAQAYDALGQPDSVIIYSERYLGSAEALRGYEDILGLAPTYRRLGELYEEKGNRTKAANYYQKFVDLWRNADPELQPQVTDVKKKLARVVGEK